MRLVLAVLIAAASTSIHADGFFKWTDPATGATVYSSEPPAAAVKSVEQKRIVRSTIETSNLPYGVQHAVKRSPIVLYVSDCGEYCTAARAYLAKRGVPFTERNPQQPKFAEQLKKVSGGTLPVPFLMVGTKAIPGFDEAKYAAALETAGYPRSSLASLGAKPGKSAPNTVGPEAISSEAATDANRAL
jgi:glutaredoxin